MRLIIYYLLGMICLTACKNSDHEINLNAATINVVHAAIDIPVIKVNPSGNPMSYARAIDSVKFGTNRFFHSPVGGSTITVVVSQDTTKILFKNTFNLKSGVYSMYIAGVPTAPDTIFREEINYPFINVNKVLKAADSVVNIRFINLSPNSMPLKIKIASSTISEIDNLPYKSIGTWKSYSAKAITTTYAFQIRNAATDVLLTTFNFTANTSNRFKNVTLVIKGLQGTTTGTNTFGVFAVNYF